MQIPVREIGRYRLKKLLGEGGMGVGYLAERDDLGSLAAIKIRRDTWLAQVNHPSIAHLYDAGKLPDGTPWFEIR